MNNVIEREPIGIKDANGNDIHLGDIVEFYCCADHGISKDPSPCGRKTVDFIGRVDTDSPIPHHKIRTYYAVNLLASALAGLAGMFATKIEGKCRIIGSLPKDAHLLIDEVPAFFKPRGDAYKNAVELAALTPLILQDRP